MSDFDSNGTSSQLENPGIQTGPAAKLLIGGSGNTDIPINTGANIRTPSLVQDAYGYPIHEGIVEWSISTNPHQPGIQVHRTNQRDSVVTGEVKESFSLTYVATYNNLRATKTIPVKAISDPKIYLASPPHDKSYPAGAPITLRVLSSGIPPQDTQYFTVRYIRPGGPGLGVGHTFPNFEFATTASSSYTGLNTVLATLHDNRTNKESSLIKINFTVT